MLHLLNSSYYGENQDKIKHFILSEMNCLFEWIRLFLITILDAHMGKSELCKKNLNTNYIKNFNYQNLNNNINKSIKLCYKLLSNSNNLNDKVTAITITLNTWHDSASLFCRDVGLNIELSTATPAAPFTKNQLDNLSNLPKNLIENKLKKLFY
jgi:hypothetical protein